MSIESRTDRRKLTPIAIALSFIILLCKFIPSDFLPLRQGIIHTNPPKKAPSPCWSKCFRASVSRKTSKLPGNVQCHLSGFSLGEREKCFPFLPTLIFPVNAGEPGCPGSVSRVRCTNPKPTTKNIATRWHLSNYSSFFFLHRLSTSTSFPHSRHPFSLVLSDWNFRHRHDCNCAWTKDPNYALLSVFVCWLAKFYWLPEKAGSPRSRQRKRQTRTDGAQVSIYGGAAVAHSQRQQMTHRASRCRRVAVLVSVGNRGNRAAMQLRAVQSTAALG